MSEEEYLQRVAELLGIILPDPVAEKHICFSYKLEAPVWKAVEWAKKYLALPE